MKHYNDTKTVKVKKLADKWEATHLPTRLNYKHDEKLMAVFELGRLVEKQMDFEFEKKLEGKNARDAYLSDGS
jgi:hypothetical protein